MFFVSVSYPIFFDMFFVDLFELFSFFFVLGTQTFDVRAGTKERPSGREQATHEEMILQHSWEFSSRDTMHVLDAAHVSVTRKSGQHRFPEKRLQESEQFGHTSFVLG